MYLTKLLKASTFTNYLYFNILTCYIPCRLGGKGVNAEVVGNKKHFVFTFVDIFIYFSLKVTFDY